MANESGYRSILVVEDNELNREMLCAMLEDRYNVLQAENGKEGLEVLQENYRDISIIVLDVQMPVMNGYEFLHAVKDDDLLKEIPVVVATGSSDIEEEERCLELGASDFVIKPYKKNIVLKRISNIIRLRESASTLKEVEFDDLTGVFTRQAFFHHAQKVLQDNPDIDFTLAISDIQDFTLVKERYGMKVANDLLLRNVALLRKAQVENYVFGRYDDNQFIVMAPSSERYAEIRKQRRGRLTIPLPEEGVAVLKFGVKRSIEHDVSIKEHCRHVLMALDTIKHVYGVNYTLFDENMQKYYDRRIAIERSMVKALENGDFQIFYQPKHDSRTGELIGAEALVRWTHPEFGFLSPAEFIPVFEQTGFISEVDFYAWKRTCMNQREWQDKGLRIVPISVNCSRSELLQNDFLHKWFKPLKDSALSSQYMHLEVTESLFTEHFDKLSEVLRECQQRGVKIELDDFGTGYSSLSMFQLLPLDIIKFDMAFVKGLDNPRQARVMAACVRLVHNLGLKSIAEGVETSQQLEKVKEMGIDAVQGYYYSRPLPKAEFEQYLMSI
jgi:EAL domain-containing protein (putative c-di-GMP-specific phosphodiesterase class I)/CheY-like chemotaxis protein